MAICIDENCQAYKLNHKNYTATVIQNKTSAVIELFSKIKYNGKMYDVRLPNNCSYLFSDNHNLEKFTLHVLAGGTTNVTNTAYMFDNCINLKEIDLVGFNTENVGIMTHMFSNCESLKSLNLSKFDLFKVKDISYMLSNCTKLKRLSLSNILNIK